MPSGGYRPGAGRPKGSVAKKHQVTVADVGHAEYLPLEYMLALMRDERTEASRRDAMAIQAASFCHPRLNAVATTNANGSGPSGDINIVQILAVPRGARIDKSGAVLTLEGEAVELAKVEPYTGSAPLGLSDQTAPPAPIEPPERLPIHELDVSNVTVLRRRSDDDPEPGAACFPHAESDARTPRFCWTRISQIREGLSTHASGT